MSGFADFPLACGLSAVVDPLIPGILDGTGSELLERVTPVTAELLRYWFQQDYCELRELNFHAGQRPRHPHHPHRERHPARHQPAPTPPPSADSLIGYTVGVLTAPADPGIRVWDGAALVPGWPKTWDGTTWV